MDNRVCPPWIGYLLLFPLRKWFENPRKRLGPYISSGMTVLEPGCGMGFFTLPMARMVGPAGKVVVVDIQPKMLEVVGKRARKVGLSDRLECRLANGHGLGIEELAGQVDFCPALHLVHEVPDQQAFFGEVYQALKPHGLFLIAEPKGHVSDQAFQESVKTAVSQGFEISSLENTWPGRSILLKKAAANEPL